MFIIFLIIVFVLAVIIGPLLLFRNELVFKFRQEVYNTCRERFLYSDVDIFYIHENMPSYDTMMLKFWIPLKLKYWISEEDLKKLKG